ncbi:ureidoglycolate lyase [Lichenihabitans sp. PAMC28606]|uniref:ureidoglycolate lyase n=1 Tax=Lichenihabitans sp. PAMC28606 TaxID=2880932 RepID=UPI001D0B66D2|nr:ureidoglycolate lyase [Lichenihabitans sp. PAMC28606]UDL93957.1 ureidoglycolate lyase [Lichenihabitans sp. PAMC28606]
MRIINVTDLTGEAFEAYGEVVVPARITTRVDRVARLENKRDHAEPNLFMVTTTTTSVPHRFDKMESHPDSSQTFLPFAATPILIAVALPGPDGQPNLSTLKGFLASGAGFSYRAGVWHLPLASLGEPVAAAGFMYEDGTSRDCVWADVEPVTLVRD